MSTFKCLSVSQPFADLIIKGKKIIELRHWNTNYRGEILIHSPTKIMIKECKRLKIDPSSLVTGVIIGKVVIYDTKRYHTKSEYLDDKRFHFAPEYYFTEKTFGFLLKSPKDFKNQIPMKGKLGIYDVEIPSSMAKENDIITEIFDEEYRTQWINHH